MSDKVYTALYPLDFNGYMFFDFTQMAIQNYYYRKLHPGSFVYHMLCNNFVGAALHADTWNHPMLPHYARWLNERMPPAAWGSKEVVDAWLGNEHNAV
jgi:hypothetical protein